MKKVAKPTRKELIEALKSLTEWATGTNKDGEHKYGNPYNKEVVRYACALLARERGSNAWPSWNEEVKTPPEILFVARNARTGRYYAKDADSGYHFYAGRAMASKLTGTELAVVKHSFLNVVAEVIRED